MLTQEGRPHMAHIYLKHGDHVDDLQAHRGITIITSRGYPATNLRQRLLRRLVGRWI